MLASALLTTDLCPLTVKLSGRPPRFATASQSVHKLNGHPVDRSCGSYHPGHRVHWIQAKKSREPQLRIDVTLTVRVDGVIDITSAEETIVRWNHDPDRLRMAWNHRGRAQQLQFRDLDRSGSVALLSASPSARSRYYWASSFLSVMVLWWSTSGH